uniref:Uncharacterized protein n=1 Tax=Pseudomonas aeruginosa TaxID=287 RepID=A0A2L1KEM4_PSEAI|nr:Hypothetical protein [Pseudomonas aeruginosa]
MGSRYFAKSESLFQSFPNEFVSTIIKGHQAEARREIQLMAKRAR